jgi:hypothetical protein
MAPAGESPSAPSLWSLLVALVGDPVGTLRRELQGMRAELTAETSGLLRRAGALGIGGMIALLGGQALVACAILALARWFEPWLAALIVGGVGLVCGAIVMLVAWRRLGRRGRPAAPAPAPASPDPTRDLFDALRTVVAGKANGSRTMIDIVKNHPIPTALIGLGIGWLIYDGLRPRATPPTPEGDRETAIRRGANGATRATDPATL